MKKNIIIIISIFVFIVISATILIFFSSSDMVYNEKARQLFNIFWQNIPTGSKIFYWQETNNGGGGITGNCYIYNDIIYQTDLDKDTFLKQWKAIQIKDALIYIDIYNWYNPEKTIIGKEVYADDSRISKAMRTLAKEKKKIVHINFSSNTNSYNCDPDKVNIHVENFMQKSY